MLNLSHRSGRPARARALIAAVAGGALLMTLPTALAQPATPDDGALREAESVVRDGERNVSDLVAEISRTEAGMDRIEREMGGLREAVNKALVDLQDARSLTEGARQEVLDARTELDQTQQDIEQAQDALDEISRTAYRHGGAPAVVTGAAGAVTAENSLARQSHLRAAAEKQQATIEDLELVRTQNANQESQLRVARNHAEDNEAQAGEAEAAARTTLEENSARLAAYAAEREQLVAARDAAQAQLDADRGRARELTEQQQAAEEADGDPAGQESAELIARHQPEHTVLDNPYPEAGDEQTASGPIAALQNAGSSGSSAPGVGRHPAPTLESLSELVGSQFPGGREERIETAIARAESQLGVPYAWGGGSALGPTPGLRDGGIADENGDFNKIGFDCSGLTMFAYAGAGVALPHYSGYQYHHGTQIDAADIQRGDLIFYGPGGREHVAIYLGDGMMIEAPNSGSVVQKAPVRWSGMSEYAVRLI